MKFITCRSGLRGVLALLVACCAPLTISAAAQSGLGNTTAQDLSREEMWAAPTEEDWAKPCLITWQRSWTDAVAVSKETGKPILVCVNMDGEIASEHYAGIRYRQPEVAALYEPYVTVIGSVYRHNPRDFDEDGQRIPCPRFGTVTCGEHIWIEPVFYEKFLDEKRIAPRHIMVELDGSEVYDVFYAFDTAGVFDSIKKGIDDRPAPPERMPRGDLGIVELVNSHAVEDRVAVEQAFLAGDRVLRKSLLQAAIRFQDVSQVDMLRLALFGSDPELSQIAFRALCQSESESAIDLIAEVLRMPMDDTDRQPLVAALVRLGEIWPRASTLAAVHQGLSGSSERVNLDGWSKVARGTAAKGPNEATVIESRIEYQAEVAGEANAGPVVQLGFAEALLELAVHPTTETKLARVMYEDVRSAANKAREQGAEGWRLNAVLAISNYNLGEIEAAHGHAEAAVGDIPDGEESWNAMTTLAIFAQARRQAITTATREKRPWPPSWFSDLHATYSVLARHPLGNDAQVVAHYDFMRRYGADQQAVQALDVGLERFPDSWELHARLRARILHERGLGGFHGLEAVYESMLEEASASVNLEWYAGYASLVVAEFLRREGSPGEAHGAYARAIEHYEQSLAANVGSRASSDHYIALALAGQARIAAEAGAYPKAVDLVVASFTRREDAAASLDGLGLSPVGTAKMLLARLEAEEKPQLAERIQGALDALDPVLLELPAFERGGPRPPNNGRRGRRRGGR